MRKLKSILICILTVISVCCLSAGLSACNDNATADKPSVVVKDLQLYSTEFTLNVGATSKIEFAYGGKEKVEFTSSNTQIVTVDDSGVITGVSDGKTTVKIKAGEESIECRVFVVQTEYGVNIGNKEVVIFTDTTKYITATAFADGVAYDTDIEWSVTNIDDCTVSAKNNVLKFISSNVGVYVVTAKTDKAESSCVIKVVEKTATRLDAPTVNVDGCKTLKWAAVEGVSSYAYSVNFGEWQTVSAQTLQVEVDNITKDLLYNETAIFSVKSLATDNFACIDSVPSTVYFKHAYVGGATTATCVKEDAIEYVCSDCEQKYTNEHYMPAHNYVSGVCSECKGYQTLGVTYMWDDALKCYFLAGVSDSTLEVLHVAGTYNDGEHGEAPVSYVKAGALSGNKSILHVTLPESVKKIYSNAFMDMDLRSIMILGIERFYGPDSDDYTGINHFLNSWKLEKLIVRKNFTSSVQSFVQNTKHNDRNMSIYVMERGGTVALAGQDYSAELNNGGLCNGNVYYMDETGTICQTWRFAENGYDIIFNDTEHNYVKGECVFCGKYDSHGITYAFDDEKQCYYVAKNGAFEGKVAKILSEYNDGETGVYPVEYVAAGAFMDNYVVETVVLPESVTSIGGNAFFHMKQLHTLIMPGVELVQSGEGYGMNHVVRVNNLRNLVVKKDFVAKGSYQIFVNDTDGTGTLRSMDVYAMEKGGTISIGGTNQNLFSGNIYYYDETLSICDTWCFGEDGYTIVKSPNTHDYDQNGDCIYCDEIVKTVELDGFTFTAAEDRLSYVLTAYSGEETEVIVPEKVFDKPVSAIGSSAFWTNTAYGRCTNGNITKITLPKSVTFLGGSCFRDQKNLTTVIMPGVTKIDVTVSNMQFHNCIRLKTVIVGESLEITNDNSLGDGPNRVFAYDNSALEEGVTTVEVELFITSADGAATYFTGNGWGYFNGMLSADRTYNYDENGCGGTWTYDENGNIKLNQHSCEDGLCVKCGALQTAGLIYELNADGNSYKVTGYKGSATEIYVAKEYEGKPVTAIGGSAFWRYGNSNFTNYNVTKVVLPASVTTLGGSSFRQMAELETVIAPGVTKIDTPVDGGMQFYDCAKLKTIVVGESLTITENAANWNDCRVFFADAVAVKTDIYLSSIDGGINIYSLNDRNSMLSGNVYYYCTTDCLNTWQYDKDGNVVKSLVTEHSYQGGMCENCGALRTQGVIYTLKEDGQSYVITGYSGSETELYFANVYRGKPVTEIKGSVFFNNKTITKVVFGENLTKIGGYNFMFCSNLETVIAPGVTYIDTTAETGESGMHFHDCEKLKTVVFGTSITIGGPNRCFSIDGADDTVVYAGVNIYLTSADGTLTATGIGHTSSQNRMLSQDRVFHYSKDEKVGCWHYDENGMPAMW